MFPRYEIMFRTDAEGKHNIPLLSDEDPPPDWFADKLQEGEVLEGVFVLPRLTSGEQKALTLILSVNNGSLPMTSLIYQFICLGRDIEAGRAERRV